MHKFFEKRELNWKHVIDVCTDGAPVMIGYRFGCQTLVKEKSPDVIGTHCSLDCQPLMVKTIPDQLKNVLDGVTKAVSFIEANTLNSLLFQNYAKKAIPNS